MKSISCKEAVRFILVKEEGKLSVGRQLSLWRHLAICSLCRIFSLQNNLMNEAIKQWPAKPLALTEIEKEEMIRKIMEERSR
ncbi:MAG TPA: hypothetical protein VGD40_14015 [Chryseosolibacter sp.]